MPAGSVFVKATVCGTECPIFVGGVLSVVLLFGKKPAVSVVVTALFSFNATASAVHALSLPFRTEPLPFSGRLIIPTESGTGRSEGAVSVSVRNVAGRFSVTEGTMPVAERIFLFRRKMLFPMPEGRFFAERSAVRMKILSVLFMDILMTTVLIPRLFGMRPTAEGWLFLPGRFIVPAVGRIAATRQVLVVPTRTEAFSVCKGATAGATIFSLITVGTGTSRCTVIISASERTPFFIFLVFQVYLQSTDMHAGQGYGHSLPEAERLAAVFTAEFLPFLIKYVVVPAKCFHSDHAFRRHTVKFHEKAEIHDAADDASEAFSRSSQQKETPHAASDFPLCVGCHTFAGIALICRFQQFVSRRKRSPRIEAENIA